MPKNNKPLEKYYRQPSVYISLPTKGKYYTSDVFTQSETGEIPILPMTAKDELAFKTPDAMINGQATVDVIKSCVPNFLDPWKMTNYDTDAILLAIRIATYGETMDITYQIPVINETQAHTINLPALLENIRNIDIVDEATTKKGFKIKIAPLDYKTLTKIQTAQFEQQKIYATVTASNLTEQAKSKQFVDSFNKLNNINFSLLIESIKELTTPGGDKVTDADQIKEFCNNCETAIINEIQEKLSEIRVQAQIKPLIIKATEEQVQKGVPETYNVPVTFDNSNFFG